MDDASVTFDAPWSASLKWITALATLVLFMVACVGSAIVPPGITGGPPLWVWRLSMIVGPAACLIICMLLAIRGYTLTPEALYIVRPLWRTRVDLAGLTSAAADPEAMRRSFKTLGNDGLFSITGWFYNRQLGHYRAWATDRKRAVVLKFGQRICVVTPDDPQAFVTALGF